jgi:hypothetical protein
LPQELGVDDWSLERISGDGLTSHPVQSDGDHPRGNDFRGVLGKFEYVAEFDVYLGVLDPTEGNVWAFKPDDWMSDTDIV